MFVIFWQSSGRLGRHTPGCPFFLSSGSGSRCFGRRKKSLTARPPFPSREPASPQDLLLFPTMYNAAERRILTGKRKKSLKKVQDAYLCFQALPSPQLCPLALCHIFKYIIFLPGSPRLGSTPNFTERQSPQQCRRFYRKAEQHPARLCLVI